MQLYGDLLLVRDGLVGFLSIYLKKLIAPSFKLFSFFSFIFHSSVCFSCLVMFCGKLRLITHMSTQTQKHLAWLALWQSFCYIYEAFYLSKSQHCSFLKYQPQLFFNWGAVCGTAREKSLENKIFLTISYWTSTLCL